MYSKEMILREIKRIAKELGQNSLKSKVFEEHSTVSLNTVRFYLGTWKEAVKEAGLNVRESMEIVKTKDLLAELIRLYEELGEPPTPAIIKKHGIFAEKLYYKKWSSLSEAFSAAKKKVTDKVKEEYRERWLSGDKKDKKEEKSVSPEDTGEAIVSSNDDSSEEIKEVETVQEPEGPVQIDLYADKAEEDVMEDTLEQGSKLDLPLADGVTEKEDTEKKDSGEESGKGEAPEDEELSRQIDNAYGDSAGEPESPDGEIEADEIADEVYDNSATLEIAPKAIEDQITGVKKSEKGAGASKKSAAEEAVEEEEATEAVAEEKAALEPEPIEEVLDNVVKEKTDEEIEGEELLQEPEIPEEKVSEEMNESDIDDIIESAVKKPKKRRIVGEPIDFRGLRYAPINKQGVVFLFAMASRDLGYIIECMGPEFPDAEGKRCFDKENNQWEHVTLGIGYRSTEIKELGVDENSCDVIVCWVHDWMDCPFDVLELRNSLGQIDS